MTASNVSVRVVVASFQTMLTRCIVIDARVQSRDIGKDDVTLRGMKVPAGRVASQGPAGLLVLLPRGESEGKLEQGAHAFTIDGARRNRQVDDRGPLEGSKGIRL